MRRFFAYPSMNKLIVGSRSNANPLLQHLLQQLHSKRRFRSQNKRDHRLMVSFVLAAELGFEPRHTESESAVLPLHNSAKCLYILTHNFPFVKYFFCFFIFFSERMIFVAKNQFSPLKKGCPDMRGNLFLYYYLS